MADSAALGISDMKEISIISLIDNDEEMVRLAKTAQRERELNAIIHVLVKKLGGVVSIGHAELINANYDLQVSDGQVNFSMILKVGE